MKSTPLLCAGRSVAAVAVAAALAMVFASASPTLAEIEPKYYRAWQLKATEILTIVPVSVRPLVRSENRRGGEGILIHTQVEAEAIVQSVTRSASGLKPGDTIRIEYTTTRADPPMAGPRPIPVLKRGQPYPAFLFGVTQGMYAPAAKGASFEPLIELK